jgi:hypothetical protein
MICYLEVLNMAMYYVIKVAIVVAVSSPSVWFASEESLFLFMERYLRPLRFDLDTQNGSVELVAELTSSVCSECRYGKVDYRCEPMAPVPRLPRRRVPLLWMCLPGEGESSKLARLVEVSSHYVSHED